MPDDGREIGTIPVPNNYRCWGMHLGDAHGLVPACAHSGDHELVSARAHSGDHRVEIRRVLPRRHWTFVFREGSKIISFLIKEGVKRDTVFILCKVAKTVGSASYICRGGGHRVVFKPEWSDEGSYIERLEAGEVMRLTIHKGLYVLDTRVAPQS